MKSLVAKIRNGLCQVIGEILLEAHLVSPADIEAAVAEQEQTHELLGQILVRRGLITQDQLVDILELQLNHRQLSQQQLRLKLGEILVERADISRWQLAQALSHAGAYRKKTGEVLVELGYASRGTVEQALSHQAIGAERSGKDKTPRKSIGQLLLEAGRLTPQQLESVLEEQEQTQDYLGSILVRRHLLTSEELDDLLATQLLTETQGQSIQKKLGEILLEFRQISRAQLDIAMSIQQRCQRKLGDILVELRFLPKKEVSRALRLQHRLATLAMTTLLGLTMLNGCGTPKVPFQMAPPTAFTTAGSQMAPPGQSPQLAARPSSATSPALRGDFTVLDLAGGKSMKVFKSGAKILDTVPFMRQGDDNTCAQATIASVLNYWGDKTSYQEIVNESNRGNMPTTHDAITRYLRDKGLNAQDYRGATLNNLMSQINQGRPAIVLLDFGGLSQEHYVVVVGYNKKKGTLIIHDSLEGPFVELQMKVFEKMWENKAATNLPLFGGPNYQRLIFDVYK